jgi:lipopolysaccharide/colanic/teichoic acid biosynthesis glycosyltransferase
MAKWIRKLKLDEFPQLINVMRGDIDIVGPRPGLEMQTKLLDARSIKRYLFN